MPLEHRGGASFAEEVMARPPHVPLLVGAPANPALILFIVLKRRRYTSVLLHREGAFDPNDVAG